ncbi:MAG: hypothetical protein ACFHX7_14150 [Pseudomonadota bacterium]
MSFILLNPPLGDSERFEQSLRGIGYRFWEESDNPAYRLFLG